MKNIGEALTGFIEDVNQDMMKKENDSLVRTGFVGQDNYIDIHSPKGEKKIRVRFPPHKNIKI